MLSKIIKTDKQKQTLLSCPNCRGHLDVSYYRDVKMHLCLACKGVWVEHKNQDAILGIKSIVLSLDELNTFTKRYTPPHTRRVCGYLPCPCCGELMWRKNWGSYSGVVVDRCRDHGTWFDEGELEKVQEYVSLGGPEYEKYKLAMDRLEGVERRIYRMEHKIGWKMDYL